MNPTRVVVIGAGRLGKIHARLLRQLPTARLVGIVDSVPSAREQLAAELQSTPFASAAELHGQIDAAIVATPTQHHHDVALELLRQGVHVLVEKPITLDASEAQSLIAAADAHHVVLQVGHVERFNPAFVAARSHLPPPLLMETARTAPYTCRSTDIGVVLDLMIHDLDLVLTLAQSEVVQVQALGAAVFGPHEDWAQAQLTFASGCVANLRASRVSPTVQRTLEIQSTTGYAALDLGAKTATIVNYGQHVLHGQIDVNGLSAEQRTHVVENLFTEYLPKTQVPIADSNAILQEQQDFLTAIQTGAKVQVSGRDGLAALEIAELILREIAAQSRRQAKSPAAILAGPHWNRTPANKPTIKRRSA